MSDDRGSTLPLLLGFLVIALLVTAGAVALGDAFVQQRGLQSVCDGAAAAAGAAALDLSRHDGIGASVSAPLAGVEAAVREYLDRDAQRRPVQALVRLSSDARRVDVECRETQTVAFGALFGKAGGVRHVAYASARAAVS